jgi:hypothetical protein
MRSGPSPFRRRSSTAWAWLAMLAVIVRCVIAPGLMPDVRAAAQGEFKLVICSAGGAKTIPVDNGGDPASGDADAHALCPFAAFAHLATIETPAAPPAPPAGPSHEAPAAQKARLAPVPLTLSARGPPLLS